MRILASSRSLHRPTGPFAIGIGIFDGVHRGHQALLRQVVQLADDDRIESLAFTFHPHPAVVVGHGSAPQLLEPIELRIEHLETLGVEAVLVERFDQTLATVPAETFVRDILVGKLQAEHVVVGEGFIFGAGGTGNVELLRRLGTELDFTVHAVEPIHHEGRVISSTRVRELLRAGAVRDAAALLGRPPVLVGVVVRGAQRGKQLGYGTANLRADNPLLPANGVYAARAEGPFGRRPAVVNVGHAPTFEASEQVKIEAHMLDYGGHELYGQPFRLHLIDRLRDEQRFASADALVAQIERDIAAARTILAAND